MALSRFVSVRGWPEIIYSDPGSQLIGAERELAETWKSIDRQSLHKSGTENGLTWIFGPADSPWYQGAVESLVKSAKRAIHFAINNQRLSVQEFMTVCSEATNLLNERPIGTLTSADSELNILTPNSLLLGRATAKNPGGWQPNSNNPGKRYHAVQIVTDEFWKKWTELYAPALVIRRKWNTANRNLCPGDVVIIADRNTLRGDYRLGIVQEVFPSQDGKVRRVNVMYKNFQIGEKVQKYKGCHCVTKCSAIIVISTSGYGSRPGNQVGSKREYERTVTLNSIYIQILRRDRIDPSPSGVLGCSKVVAIISLRSPFGRCFYLR